MGISKAIIVLVVVGAAAAQYKQQQSYGHAQSYVSVNQLSSVKHEYKHAPVYKQEPLYVKHEYKQPEYIQHEYKKPEPVYIKHEYKQPEPVYIKHEYKKPEPVYVQHEYKQPEYIKHEYKQPEPVYIKHEYKQPEPVYVHQEYKKPEPVYVQQEYKHEPEHYAHPKYAFKYGVHDSHTGDVKDQQEERDGDVVKGEYSLLQPDGRKRIVHYTADKHSGFNAVVSYSGHAAHPEGYKKAESAHY
ncbi:cardiomyopathy-associated protein 5-like [Frankliniella occidentalis]|uniref:Cardiomyopathy-associated protein 5-like n=1 Tax=Frankliniella occidentalis TaxID=133901 RepID=A0A6J1TMW2_FRAOC|nr:cardiomyopathy-associated protein 5-like [Frankliniella occidentalis]